jgi:hypothetical protein
MSQAVHDNAWMFDFGQQESLCKNAVNVSGANRFPFLRPARAICFQRGGGGKQWRVGSQIVGSIAEVGAKFSIDLRDDCDPGTAITLPFPCT